MYLLINSTSCFLDNYIPSVINIFLLIYNCIKFTSKIICKKEKKKKKGYFSYITTGYRG